MIFTKEFMEPIFLFMEGTKGVPQDPKYHPEGDVFIHLLQTMYHAFRESDDTDLIMAAMLHDIGKAGLPLGHRGGHEQVACEWLRDYVSHKTSWLIEHHMRVWPYINGEMRKLSKCIYLADHQWLPELIQLARWDKMARNRGWKPFYSQDVIRSSLNARGMARFHTLKEMDNARATAYLRMMAETGMSGLIKERVGQAWQSRILEQMEGRTASLR